MNTQALPGWDDAAKPACGEGARLWHLPWRTLLAASAVLLALRIGVLLASGAGLHVDEAQYWDWSRSLQWGYYSKPPAIAALIALGTGASGSDHLLAVRIVPMLCWLASAWVLAWLAADMVAAARHGSAAATDALAPARAALMAFVLFCGTLAAGLLGMSATTDAPLLLCWSLALAAGWRAWQADETAAELRAWLVCGLAFGLGLLSKYTMAAFLLGFAPLWWTARRADDRTRRTRLLRGLVVVASLGLLLSTPNLAWNAAAGWPTLAHTADITVAASNATPGLGARLASLAGFLGGQVLLLGLPAAGCALLVLVRLLRRRRPAHAAAADLALADDMRYVWALSWPLLALAAAQAWHAQAQINWAAPSLAGICVALGLGMAHRGSAASASWPQARRRAWLLLAAGAVPAALLASAALWLPAGAATERVDLWARMRGWDAGLQPMRKLVLREAAAAPGAAPEMLVSSRRDVLAQARYAFRDEPQIELRALRLGDGAPAHHYELLHGLSLDRAAAVRPQRWWWLDDRPPPDAALHPQSQARLQATVRIGKLDLQLWRIDEADSRPATVHE